MKIPSQSTGTNRRPYVSYIAARSIGPSLLKNRFEFRSACNSCGLTHCDGCCTSTHENGISTCTCDCNKANNKDQCTNNDVEKAGNCMKEKDSSDVSVFVVDPPDPRSRPFSNPPTVLDGGRRATRPTVPGITRPVIGRTFFG